MASLRSWSVAHEPEPWNFYEKWSLDCCEVIYVVTRSSCVHAPFRTNMLECYGEHIKWRINGYQWLSLLEFAKSSGGQTIDLWITFQCSMCWKFLKILKWSKKRAWYDLSSCVCIKPHDSTHSEWARLPDRVLRGIGNTKPRGLKQPISSAQAWAVWGLSACMFVCVCLLRSNYMWPVACWLCRGCSDITQSCFVWRMVGMNKQPQVYQRICCCYLSSIPQVARTNFHTLERCLKRSL